MKKYITLVLLFIIIFTIPLKATTNKQFKDNEFIIKLENKQIFNKKLKIKIEKTLNNKIISSNKIKIGSDVYYSIKLSNALSNINNLSKIENAQPMFIYTTNEKQYIINSIFTKNDPIPNNAFWHINTINADKFKEKIDTIENKDNWIKVGVIDTGIDSNHVDLNDDIVDCNYDLKSSCIDKDGHGSHVAGIIGSKSDSGYGVGKNIKIVSLNALKSGSGSSLDIAKAINYANNNNILILNASFGYSGTNDYTFIEAFHKDEFMYTAIKNYKGLFIAAAGNDKRNRSSLPAGYTLDNIISVGASNFSDERAKYSNYHKTKVDVFAPGGDGDIENAKPIYSSCSPSSVYKNEIICKENNVLIGMSGTSMATPMVTAIIATSLSQDPTLSTSELKDALIDSVKPNKVFINLSLTGGIIDADKFYDELFNKTFAKLNKSEGTIELWGNNENGKLGNNSDKYVNENSPIIINFEEGKIVKYYIKEKNVYLLTDQGNLYVSGSNSFGQLGQENNNDSKKFVKFTKISEDHKIESLSFRDLNGKKDDNSLKINLKGSKDYYKLGNNSFVPSSTRYDKASGLQYIKHGIKKDTTGYISAVYYYNKNTYENPKKESYVYNEYYYIGNMYYYELYKRVLKNNDNQTIKTLYFNDGPMEHNNFDLCSEDYYKVLDYYYFSKIYKAVTTSHDLTCKYYSNSDTTSISRKLYSKRYSQYDINTFKKLTTYVKYYNSSSELSKIVKVKYRSDGIKKSRYIRYDYRNGVKTKRMEYVYNKNGELKTNKYGKAYKYVSTYKKGKRVSIYKSYYNSKGKVYKSIKLKKLSKDFSIDYVSTY